MSTIPQETSTSADRSETIGVFDRLDTLRRQAGFLATTRGEVNEAFGLLSFADSPGGAAAHLAEIGAHQTTHGVDPIPAQISVTREYAGYAGRARLDRTMLRTLEEEMYENGALRYSRTLDPTKLQTGQGQLARFVDLVQLAKGKDPSKFAFIPLRGYSKGERNALDPYIVHKPQPEVVSHITATLAAIPVAKAPRIVKAAMSDQQQRFAFWSERLQEIESHQMGAIRAVARAGLEGLGIYRR